MTRPRGTPATTWAVRGTGVIGLIGIALVLLLPGTAPLVGLGILSLWLNGPFSMFFPTTLEPIVMLFGRVYEPALVAAAATAGNMYVEFLNYHLYRKVLTHDRLRSLRQSRAVQIVVRLFRRAPFFTIWLCAWSVFPYWTVRFVAPQTDYPLRRYMTATLLGRFPKMWLFASLGVWLGLSADLLLPLTGAVILVGVSVAFFRRLRGRPAGVDAEEVSAGMPAVPPPVGSPPVEPAAALRQKAENTGRIDLLVDAPEFVERLTADLAAAGKRAWLQASTFEGDEAGRSIAGALLACPALDRRVLVDHYTLHFHSDRFLYAPWNLLDAELRAERASTSEMFDELERGGVGVRFVNPAGLFFFRIQERQHKKIVIVDDDVAYIGGINFSDHNFAWHDLMLRIEHAGVASFLRGDFEATWCGVSCLPHGSFEGIELYSGDGANNEKTFEPILQLIGGARHSVIVHSAYITFPFCDALREARRHGAHVMLLTPQANNRSCMRSYIMREAQRSGFELRFFLGGMSHMKAMLVDNRWLITGSANFDWLAHGPHGEVLAVITRPEVISEFRARVLRPDLAASVPAVRLGSERRGRNVERVLRMMSRASRMIPPRSPACTRGSSRHGRAV
ncbi:MAG: phospholipase D-like domain-containing protein [Gemmatimonadales bacterium]